MVEFLKELSFFFIFGSLAVVSGIVFLTLVALLINIIGMSIEGAKSKRKLKKWQS